MFFLTKTRLRICSDLTASFISSGIQSLRSVPHEYKTSFKVQSNSLTSRYRSLREEYNTLGLSHSVQCSTLATFRANWPEGLKGIPESHLIAD